MDVQINVWAVLLATASSMVVGTIWYARGVFGDTWMKLVKLNPKDMQKGAAVPLLLTMLASLVTAYILAHVAYLSHAFFRHSFMQDAVTTAFWLWLGLTAARLLVHDLFERRPKTLTLLNVAHEFVTIMVMGLVIGAFKP